MDRQQDTSGDYGYDLAHEATGRQLPAGHPTDAGHREHPAVESGVDSGGDLEYDEAHGF